MDTKAAIYATVPGELKRGRNRMNFDNLSNSDIDYLISEWIRSERDRQILHRRLIDGICYEPLAEEFNLSVPQIKNIVYRSQDRLFRHLT